MALYEIYRDDYVTISADPKGPLVRQARTEVQFPTFDALERSVGQMIRVFDEIGRETRVLLSDFRAVQGRNDPEFEQRMIRLRPRLYGGFIRVGVLVRSSVGALQIRRFVQEDGIARVVMTDEAELLDYLLRG
jgi:hypothetical protein